MMKRHNAHISSVCRKGAVMKYPVKIMITVITAVVLTVLSCTTAFAWDHDERWMNIESENRPYGTVMLDLLVKCSGNDEWAVDFNEETAEQLGVSKDCGLANYNKDGYTSLSLRHNCVKKTSLGLHYIFSEDSHILFNKFKSVKIAFCDNKGNVISVSNSVKVPNATLRAPVMYLFETDGNDLSFRFGEGSWSVLRNIILIVLRTVALVILAIITIKFVKVYLPFNSHSGETDNERKE